MAERQLYSGNSNKARVAASSEKPKPTAVAKGSIKQPSGAKKIYSKVINESEHPIIFSVWTRAIVPNLKRAGSEIMRNAVDNFIDTFIYRGDSRPRSTTRTNYGGYYGEGWGQRREEVRGNYARNGMDFDEIVFNSRADAENVLNGMDAIIEQYQRVSVGDMYDLAGVSTNMYGINGYGWTDIRMAQIVDTRDGYVIKLPRAYRL